MERAWKLGEDLYLEDAILDSISFEDIVIMLRCNEPVIDKAAAKRCFKEMLEMRMDDAEYLLENNIEKIIRVAKNGREGY